VSSIDPFRVAALIREVAEAEILPRFRQLKSGDIREKSGPKDLVTVADIEAERRLEPLLKDLLPGSVVVGEESATADPSILNRLAGDAPAWLVDPVDGTFNFSEGDERFCVMVALVRDGQTVASWIHDPVPNVTYMAEAGSGAWCGSQRLKVAEAVAPEECVSFLNIYFFEEALRARVRERRSRLKHNDMLRCAGHEYLRLAQGKAHTALYARILPWDHAPGVLLHAEAGGHSSFIDGRPYSTTIHRGGLLLAPDRENWRQMAEFLGLRETPKS